MGVKTAVRHPQTRSAAQHTVPVPLGYKQTELGTTSEDWELYAVGQMGDVLIGKALAVNGPGHQRPYLRTKNVFDGRIDIDDVLTMPMTDTQFAHYMLVPDDVLLNEGQSLELVGRCAIYQDELPSSCAIQNQLLRFRARPGVSAQFASQLFRYCQQTGVFARIALQTTSIAHLGGSRFQRLVLPWPNREREQRAIAEALSDVDGLLAALDALIAKKGAIKQAAMQQLLTGRTRLPGFRRKWETRRLGEHVTFLRTGVNSRSELTSDGSVKYLHYGDIHTSTSVRLDPFGATMPCLSEERARTLDRLRAGDVVFVDASEDLDGIGKAVEIAAVTGAEVVAGLHTIAARFDGSVLAFGFKAYLQFCPAFREHLRRLAAGTKVYATKRTHISSAEIPLPGLDEQTAIAAVLSDMDAEINALERRRDKVRAIKKGMMQQLLTGRVRLVEPLASAARPDAQPKRLESHNWAFNEAVVIAVLAKHFGSEQYPLGRLRYTKLSYLLHRYAENAIAGYLKKAAGPYNPKTRYGGPEKIALENGYVREHKSGQYSGFIASDNIAQAEGYFGTWYGPNSSRWLEQFRYKTNDDLELLTTVDMAGVELRAAGKIVDVDGVKGVIRMHPEWKAKLKRSLFSDANIVRSIQASREFDDHARGST